MAPGKIIGSSGGCALGKGVAGFSGAFLRRTRTRLGLTAAQLAVAVGVRENTVLRWETGVAVPTPKHLVRIAQAVTVTPADLVPGIRFTNPTLRQLRLLAALDLETAAAGAALSRSALVRLERGITTLNDRGTALAAVYGVDQQEVESAATRTVTAARGAARSH